MMVTYLCPVCGYPDLDEEPYSAFGGGSYEICPSCGFQFGVSDGSAGFSIEQWRNQWIASGMKWYSEGIPMPAGWNARAQVTNARFA
jgi:hypothetical protein